MIEILGIALLALSAFCAIIGAVGLLRLPDVYNRIHAQTICVVGGAVLALFGVSVIEGVSAFSIKTLIIVIFIFLTNPVGSHIIARAAHKSGVKLWRRSVVDKLEEEKP
ncbi:MAG: hypothetical protein APU95_04420 [Hadesarchaea archaeon YNP_N21]|nr:MAG: hypothetical protein APU95_04350 [Hadesarchaea archaeon YNP_N21]KUO42805.1 MAG: hypothetical protein APU95_04420 [Hadesarchaea archaeon YNP_N21]